MARPPTGDSGLGRDVDYVGTDWIGIICVVLGVSEIGFWTSRGCPSKVDLVPEHGRIPFCPMARGFACIGVEGISQAWVVQWPDSTVRRIVDHTLGSFCLVIGMGSSYLARPSEYIKEEPNMSGAPLSSCCLEMEGQLELTTKGPSIPWLT